MLEYAASTSKAARRLSLQCYADMGKLWTCILLVADVITGSDFSLIALTTIGTVARRHDNSDTCISIFSL